ncbi:hypothetical protein Droror1_Dr00015987 [Drosera rotundifolia]
MGVKWNILHDSETLETLLSSFSLMRAVRTTNIMCIYSLEEEKALELAKDSQASRNGSTSSSGSSVAPSQDQTKYQTPASALWEADETIPAEAASGRSEKSSGSDPIATMEYYMKKGAQVRK